MARYEAEHELLSQHKRLCTGEPLDSIPREELPSTVDSLATFKELVSQIYMHWHEKWGRDVGFLLGMPRQPAPNAQSFSTTLKTIRTAHQHSTDEQAVRALNEWQYRACGARSPKQADEWATCASELIVQLTAAVTELTDVAIFVQQYEDRRTEWQQRVSESVRSAVMRVAGDIGLRLSEGTIDYHKRQVESLWRRHRVPQGRTARSELESLVERSLMARSPQLPCDHLVILRELDVIGKPSAFAVIQLAHAVATISQMRGASFLQLVVATWTSVQPAGVKPIRGR